MIEKAGTNGHVCSAHTLKNENKTVTASGPFTLK